jgi:hypothetical protein
MNTIVLTVRQRARRGMAVGVLWRMALPSGKIAAEYSGKPEDRPSEIGAEISRQIHVEEDSLILGFDFHFASGGRDKKGAATL